jgi:hypothetical protein
LKDVLEGEIDGLGHVGVEDGDLVGCFGINKKDRKSLDPMPSPNQHQNRKSPDQT